MQFQVLKSKVQQCVRRLSSDPLAPEVAMEVIPNLSFSAILTSALRVASARKRPQQTASCGIPQPYRIVAGTRLWRRLQ